MLKAILLFVIVSCSAGKLFSQQDQIDSVQRELAKAAEDSNKVKLYLLAGRTVVYQDPNEAIVFYVAGARLSTKINYLQGAGLCYMNVGNSYSFLSKADSSLLYMDTALFFLRKLNSADHLAVFFSNRADTYVQISDFKKALLDCDTATRYAELSGNKMRLAFIYNVRADIYWHLKQYHECSAYVDRALKIHHETGNIRMVAQAYADKADLYSINNQMDKAVEFYKKAIHIADSIQDESNLSRYHMLLSETYLGTDNNKRVAAAEAVKALQYAQAEDNPVQEAAVHTLLCRIYCQQRNLTEAIRHGRDGHYMAIQEVDLPLQQSSATALAEAFKEAGNTDSAYHYLLISKKLNDSLLTKNFNTETANLQISFDVAQKGKQIELLAKDRQLQQQKLKEQRVYIITSVAVALLALLGIWLAINRYRLRQRMKELELRNQIAADLHDEVGSSLSSIHMLSQMANAGIENGNQKNILDRVSNNAKETMERMSDIVWMIKPGESEAGTLSNRMERFAYEICSGKNILLQMDLTALDEIKPTMEQRKNMYLVFKEAINNAVKYSGAEKIEVNTSFANKEIKLVIRDFGSGFDSTKSGRGNGLDNMRNRANESGGFLQIDTTPGAGTEIILTVPV